MKYYIKNHMTLFFLISMGAVIYFSVPINADFGWYEAGRHAMDAFFYWDMFTDLGFFHPFDYAVKYYEQYPAIAPTMYPPVFSLAQVIGFIILGPHVYVSRLVVAIFLVWGAIGLIKLTENRLEPEVSRFSGFLFLTVPSVIYWSRDVMLETPAIAIVIWSFVFFLKYLEEGTLKNLLLFWFFATLAPYTKQNTVFMFPVILATAVILKKMNKLFEKQFIVSALISLVIGLPLIYVTFTWGSVNINQSFGNLKESMGFLNAFFYHILVLPETVGYPILILTMVSLIMLIKKIFKRSFQNNPVFVLLFMWIIFCYLQMSIIKIKEPRHGYFLLPVICIMAAYGLDQITRFFIGKKNNVRNMIIGGLVCCILLGFNVSRMKMNWSEGFAAPAQYLQNNWKGTAVLTNIFRDAPFIFHLRAVDTQRKYKVYRCSKIFESMMIYKEWGVKPLINSHEELWSALNKYGIRYILLQQPIPQMTQVEALLRESVKTDKFKLVQTFPILYPNNRRSTLVLYQYLGKIRDIGIPPAIHLPVIGTVLNNNEG